MKQSIHFISYIILIISTLSCNLDNRVGNSKALVEEMNNRKIKRVTGSQMATIIDDWGKRIVKKSQQIVDKALLNQPQKSVEYCALKKDRKSTRLNSSHITPSRMPSSA